jgi:pSer/pThr/pTyr-binding forkhead associated (FHA) protein
MRLEVLTNNENPAVFSLKSPKLTLGTSESCDIILSAEGISRKHISVLIEGDNYFVVDLGSTNGSFINEERLVPGRKTEFTSFFPVRLGHNILISLLSDEEGMEKIEIPVPEKERMGPAKLTQYSHKTGLTTLRDLKNAKTENLIQTRNEKRSGTKKVIKKTSHKKEIFVPFLSLMIVAGAAYYNLVVLNKESSVPVVPVAKVGAVVTKKGEQAIQEKSDLISEEELVKKETLKALLDDLKCTSDTEILFCDSFPGARGEKFGVVQVGLRLNILVDGTNYFDQARRILLPEKKNSDDPSAVIDQEALYDAAAYIYLLHLSDELKTDFSPYHDYRIFIALFEVKDSELVVGRVISIRPEILKRLKEFVRGDNLKFIKSNGSSALLITKKFYRTY